MALFTFDQNLHDINFVYVFIYTIFTCTITLIDTQTDNKIETLE